MTVTTRRMIALVVSVLAILFLPQAGHASATRWRNHDTDNWTGWFDASNPAALAANPQGCDPLDPASACSPTRTIGSRSRTRRAEPAAA